MKNKKYTFIWLLLPSLCGILIFYCIPFILSFYYALIDNMGNRQFVGFANFIETFQNPVFQRGLANTILFLSVGIPILILCSFSLALALKKISRNRGFILLVLLLPLVIPSGTISYFWKVIFDVNGWLNKLFYISGVPIINWQTSQWAMAIAVVIFLWKNIGLSTLLFLLGLNRIPQEYYEIADMEGAGAWGRFRHVTSVYLTPTLFVILLLAIANSFKVFKEIYILYGNYPSQNIYLLQHYMNNQFLSINMQKLTSASYILFIMIAIVIFVLFRLEKSLSKTFSNMELGVSHLDSNTKKRRIFPWLFVSITVLFILFPLLFIFSNSFMHGSEVVNRYTPEITPYNMYDTIKNGMHFVRMGVLPDVATVSQYKELLLESPTYLRLYWNSILIAIPVVLGQCIISPLGAYAFERMKWKYKEVLFFIYVLVMLMPLQVLLVPHYLVADWLGFKDNYLAIILPGIFNPMGVFLIRQQLKGFPKECIEAARVSGASEWKTLRHIVLPNLRPAIAAVAIITFAEYWNVVDQAIVFIKSPYDEPLSVYLGRIIAGDPGMFFAVSCFYLLPVIILFFIIQDYFTDGVALISGKNKIR